MIKKTVCSSSVPISVQACLRVRDLARTAVFLYRTRSGQEKATLALATMSMSSAFPTPSEIWQLSLAFLRFELFITPSVLIFMYWLGAVGIPVLAIVLIRKILHHPSMPDISDVPVWQRNRKLVIAFGITMFVFAELIWRMMIETVLAYFQMRDALVGVSSY